MSTIVFTKFLLQDLMNILHNVGLFFWFPTSLFLNKTGDHMDALPYLRRYTK